MIGALTAVGLIVGTVTWGLGPGIVVGFAVWLAAVAIRFARHPASRTMRVEESAHFPCPPSAVWSIIEPPELAPLIFPVIRRGYRLPGTPAGVGEQQAFELIGGNLMVVEVEDLIPGRRAVIRTIEPRMGHLAVHELEDTEHGCLYRLSVEFVIPARPKVYRKLVTNWRREVRGSFDRLRVVLVVRANSRSL